MNIGTFETIIALVATVGVTLLNVYKTHRLSKRPAMNGGFTTLQSDINGIKTDMGNIKTEIAVINTKLQFGEKRIDKIETKIE